MIKRWKTKVIITKYQKTKKRINQFNKKKRNYKSNTRDKINPN